MNGPKYRNRMPCSSYRPVFGSEEGDDNGLSLLRKVQLALMGGLFAFIAGSNFSLNLIKFNDRYVPEPFLVVWVLLSLSVFPELVPALRGMFRRPGYLIALVVIGFGFLLALLRSTDFVAVYGDGRATFLFVTGFCISHYAWKRRIEWEWLVLGMLATVCVLDALRPKIFEMDIDPTAVKVNMSLWAPVGVAIIGLRWKNVALLVFGFVFSVYFAKIAFFRIYYLGPFCIISMVIVWFVFLILGRWRGNLKFGLILLLLCVCGLAFGVRNFDAYVQSLSETASGRVHSIEKTSQFIDGLKAGDLSSESERLDSLNIVLFQPWRLAMPYGIGWRDSMDEVAARFSDLAVVSTMDSALLYVGFHYGIVVFYVLCVFIALYFRNCIRDNVGRYELVLQFSVLLFLALNCFLESGMLTMVPRALQFALVAGLVYQKRGVCGWRIT